MLVMIGVCASVIEGTESCEDWFAPETERPAKFISDYDCLRANIPSPGELARLWAVAAVLPRIS